METTEWVRMWADGWKRHWCSIEMLEDLAKDAQERFHEFGGVEPADSGFLDLPGMIMTDRTYQDLEVDGFPLKIPTTDFAFYHGELKHGPKRTFTSGREYYKLHGYIDCLVLSPVQRDALLALMDARIADVTAQAKAEHEEFVRRIREVNKDGVKVVTPKDPESMKGVVEKKLVSKPNGEKN